MPPSFLTLPAEAFEDLTALAAHPDLVRAVETSSDAVKRAESFASLATQLSATTGAGLADCQAVLRGLINLSRLRSAFELPVEDFLELIEASILKNARTAAAWEPSDQQAWTDCSEAVGVALNPASGLAVFEKASRLGYSYANTLVGTQVITDLRPVFDEAATGIERMSASFVLALEFFEGGQNRSLDLALDLRDIKRLRLQCLRAETKANTIKAVLENQPWATIVVGQNGDEGGE